MRPSTAKKNTSIPETSKRALEKGSEKEGKFSTGSKNKLEKRAPNITFREELSQFEINAFTIQHLHLLRQSQWKFSLKEFKDRNVSNVLADAKILLIHSFTLHLCKYSLILKEIASISFPKMTVLDLTGNKIASLEPLQLAHLPVLESLILRNNFLTSLRSLRKCNLHLEKLQISDNKIISMEGMEQLDLSSFAEMMWGDNNPIVLNQSLVKLQINYKNVMKAWIHHSQTLNLHHFFNTFDLIAPRW